MFRSPSIPSCLARPVRGRVSGQSISFNGINFTVPASGAVTPAHKQPARQRQPTGGLHAGPGAGLHRQQPEFHGADQQPRHGGAPRARLLATLSSRRHQLYGLAASLQRQHDQPVRRRHALRLHAPQRRASPSAFQVKDAGSDTGTRIVVRYTGIPGRRAPVRSRRDCRVGRGDSHRGRRPWRQAVRRRSMRPATASLLLSRVNLTDANGAGGQLVLYARRARLRHRRPRLRERSRRRRTATAWWSMKLWTPTRW